MKKVLAILAVLLLAVTSCVQKQTDNQKENQEENTPRTKLEQFVDSMKTVYPNYKDNIAVGKKMSEELEGKVATLPGILDDSKFHIVGIGEVVGNFTLMLAYEGDDEINLLIWCGDFGKDEAAKLDKTKLYRITGGSFVEVDHEILPIPNNIELGQFIVKDLTIEEIPGSHYEKPMGL